MAYLVKNEKEMTTMIIEAAARLQGSADAQMLVVPVVIAEDKDATLNLLSGVACFDPKFDGDGLPHDAVGLFRIATADTVHTALDALESHTMVDAHQFGIVMQCGVSTHVPGKTRKVRVMMLGDMVVDLQKFSEMTGLPLDTPDNVEFAVYVMQVPDKRTGEAQHVTGEQRLFIVAVRGKTDTAGGCATDARALQPMMARLKARAGSGFNTGASFYCRELVDGWHLLRNPLFPDFLGWVRGGAWYLIDANRDKGGLDLSY